jgi:hypothetical protein
MCATSVVRRKETIDRTHSDPILLYLGKSGAGIFEPDTLALVSPYRPEAYLGFWLSSRYGDACTFAHSAEELERPSFNGTDLDGSANGSSKSEAELGEGGQQNYVCQQGPDKHQPEYGHDAFVAKRLNSMQHRHMIQCS